MTKLYRGAALRRPAAKITTKMALAALLASTASQAYAEEFEITEGVTATTNVTLQAGVSIRTERPDEAIIHPLNGAQYGINGRGEGFSDDDATLNYDKGDIVSAPITAIADVDVNFDGKWGFFLRGKAVTDLALELQSVRHGHRPNDYAQGERLNDDSFDNLAKFTNAALLDAFVYTDVEIFDKPVTFRLGRQVVSWGESLFIQGGINTINPIDVPAFRRPGAQVKEGLLPVGMVYTNIGITDNLSFEAFLSYEWQKTVLDGCGTFFSTLDSVPDGCDNGNLVGGNPLIGVGGSDQQNIAAENLLGRGFLTAQKTQDVTPDDYSLDQFGAALRYYAQEIDVEFGLYYHHLHAKTPNIGATLFAFDAASPVGEFATTNNYQEDIDTFGASFSTTVMGAAVAGEFSYRPNASVQRNAANGAVAGISHSLFGDPAALTGGVVFADQDPDNFTLGFSCGCERTDQFKGQISTIMFFDQILGASRITAIGEVGFERLLLDQGDQGWGYSRAFVFSSLERGRGNNSAGTVKDFSWGYRLFARAEYPNFMNSGINFNPSMIFVHDVDGTSSDSQFFENRKGIGLGAEFGYLNTYTLQFNYVNFFDGDYFTSQDRDFASATARVQF